MERMVLTTSWGSEKDCLSLAMADLKNRKHMMNE